MSLRDLAKRELQGSSDGPRTEQEISGQRDDGLHGRHSGSSSGIDASAPSFFFFEAFGARAGGVWPL